MKYLAFTTASRTRRATVQWGLPQWLKQVSATYWPRTKSWDISLDCYIGKYRGIIRSKIFFFKSVTFQLHARMLSSEVAKSLKSYGHFSDLGVGIALSHRHVGFFGWNKYINPRSRRGRHGYIPDQQTRYAGSMFAQCWPSVGDNGPAFRQHWANSSCFLGSDMYHFWGNDWSDHKHILHSVGHLIYLTN